jgi:hypothetical protein
MIADPQSSATTSFHSVTPSEIRLVVNLVTSAKTISVPKLAAKTKISTEELDTVLKTLSDEGVLRLRTDELGFGRVDLVERQLFQRGEHQLWMC